VDAESPPPLRTYLIADVRGYTRYTNEHGDEAGAKVAARFADLARRGVTAHGGELVELRGDEALAVFASARGALRAAVELQRLFRTSFDDQPALPVGVGIGLDAGEAVPVAGGFRGGALNLASRLCSHAAAGEVLASETVVALARHVEGIRFRARGSRRFKGFDEQVNVIEVMPELPLPPLPSKRGASLQRIRRRHITRRNAIVGALIAVTAVFGTVFALAKSGGQGASQAASATRIGLVLPRRPVGSDDVYAPYTDALLEAKRRYGVSTETLVVRPNEDQLPRSVRQRLDHLDLVLLAGPSVHNQFADEVAAHPGTQFVFVDPDPEFDVSQLEKLPNYSDVFFIEGPPAYLAGYLSALVIKRESRNAAPHVSFIGIDPAVSENQEAGFESGATAAGAKVQVDYSYDVSHPAVCERIANRQIDDGSKAVYAPAGACGLGAMSAAELRGVWGIGADRNQSYLGPHILVSTEKRLGQAVDYTIRSFLAGTLRQGKSDIGIERDATDIVGINSRVPRNIRTKLANVEAQHMKEWTSFATPIP
jgi:basic membrane protein A and related proteins